MEAQDITKATILEAFQDFQDTDWSNIVAAKGKLNLLFS